MDITLADERAFLLKEQLSLEQAEGRAWEKKVDAFGRMVKVASFLQRPKDSDFELIYKEHRYEPFWHIVCRARYVYERRREYLITLSGNEVRSVSLDEKEFVVRDGRIHLTLTEHCREEPERIRFINGYTNQPDDTLNQYLNHPANEVPPEHLEELGKKGAIVVPAQARASAIVRDVLLEVLKSIQADTILEDAVEIANVDLYYHPVYAFQYRWKSKQKEAIVEYDAVTSELRTDGKTFQQYMGKLLDPEFLFDVGADTIDLLVPGGGLAVKLARKGLDVARNRSTP
ncbi:hypothetical protein [Candidatus Leptofilum sp.]|uniref:hypothetical protein n=1 Tax=Candidatus Leptofilum sp. TaxID=3241576 RepID=UPI003B5A8165